MPKQHRRRLLNSLSSPDKLKSKSDTPDREVWSARGRLQGALQEVLEPPPPFSEEDDEDSCDSVDTVSRQPYVLKLFDRSVDLAQFSEDSPLYPVCRAWIINRPRTIYAHSGEDDEERCGREESVTLPVLPPAEPAEPRAPPLTPDQLAASKHNLDTYLKPSGGVTSRDRLLHGHMQRWGGVRDAWLQHARDRQARHAHVQHTLNTLHVTM